MRIGLVIGRVVTSQAVAPLKGARWLLVSPCGTAELSPARLEETAMSQEPTLVVYDNLGAGPGDRIGYVEGREASAPFAEPTPVDAINAALIDRIFHSPKS